jgi:hypothetical protein
MRKVLAFLFILLFATGCRGSDSTIELNISAKEIDTVLASISPKEGIRYREAQVITAAYFETFLSGCGVAEGPRLRHGVWRSRARVGYAGEPLPGAIEVDSKTGGVKYAGCPSFATAAELRDAIERERREPAQGPPCWLRNRRAG